MFGLTLLWRRVKMSHRSRVNKERRSAFCPMQKVHFHGEMPDTRDGCPDLHGHMPDTVTAVPTAQKVHFHGEMPRHS